MALKHQLARWLDAELIDAATVERIRTYEAGRDRRKAVWGLGALGAGSIGLGLIAIVAANWTGLTGGQKIAADLVVGAMLAGLTWTLVTRAARWMGDTALLVYAAYVLASLALIGQIYQLGTPLWVGLTWWAVAITPMLLMGQSAAVGLTLVGALTVAYTADVIEVLTWLDDASGVDADVLGNIGIVAGGVLPLAWLAAAALPAVRRRRPAFAGVMTHLGWLAVVAAGSTAPFGWYVPQRDLELQILPGVLVLGLFTGITAVLVDRADPHHAGAVRSSRMGVLGAAWGLSFLVVAMPHGSWPVVGALTQIGFWGLCAWTAVGFGAVRLFQLATAAIALRLIVIYLEIFGSMLSTGLGLITGGLLTLGMAWLWARASREITAALRDEAPS